MDDILNQLNSIHGKNIFLKILSLKRFRWAETDTFFALPPQIFILYWHISTVVVQRRRQFVSYKIWYDIFVNCNWVATRWQQYSTHLHTNNTQNDKKQTTHRTTQNVLEECGPCPIFAGYTLAFALQLRKKHGKTSIRVAEECQLARWKYIFLCNLIN
jgi:hypothetical protein